jgi:hypothetical protein
VTHRLRAGLAAAVFAVGAAAAPAHAGNGLAMNVDVHNSHVSMQSANGASCTWEVSSDITVVNLTSQPLDVTGVRAQVSWTGPDDGSGVQQNVTVADDGGLRTGVTFAPHEQRTFSPFVTRFTMSCNATFGDLAVFVNTPQGSGSGDAPFLENGTPVPVGAVGAVALAGALGAVLLVRQRRRAAALSIS